MIQRTGLMHKQTSILIILMLLCTINLSFSASEQSNSVAYTYYSNGEIKTRKETNQAGLLVDYKVYNQSGDKMQDYSYQADGTIYEKIAYYPNGNYKSYLTKDHEQIIDYKRYDENGHLTKDYDYCVDGQLKRINQLDDDGQMKAEHQNSCQEVEKLTTAQFNVLKADDETYGTWDERKNQIVSAINSANSDIISLNEIDDESQARDIQQLTDYSLIQPTDGSDYGWTSAIAYNPDNIKLIESGGYKFKNQEVYTSGSLAGSRASRTAIWGLFEKHGIKFIFISGQTQNDWYTDIRFLQLQELVDLGHSLSEQYNVSNVVIAGDFNQKIPFSNKCTYSLPTYIGTEHDLSYDYVCSSTGMNTRGNIINSNASDHALVYSSTTIADEPDLRSKLVSMVKD